MLQDEMDDIRKTIHCLKSALISNINFMFTNYVSNENSLNLNIM